MAVVNVIYHHFPHYRAPVMRELVKCGVHEYRFWGGTNDYAKIRAFKGDDIVKIHPLCFVGHDNGSMEIKNYWPAVNDKSADVLIIIGNANIRATWIMALAGRMKGKRIIFWAHGWTRREKPLKARVRNFYYNLAHCVMVYGDRAKQLARDSGFDDRKIISIYNSLDWTGMQADAAIAAEVSKDDIAKEFDLQSGKRTVICTARLTKICQFDLLLEAAEKLQKNGLALQVVLVGDGPEKEKLQRIANEKKLQVVFLGEIYDEQVIAKLYRFADLCVSPGKVGLTAMHSLSHGVPVITHGDFDRQMPEVEAIRPGQTGLYFDYGNSDSLSQAISDWFSRDQDPDKVAEACREEIRKRWNPQVQVTQIDFAVNQVLGIESK